MNTAGMAFTPVGHIVFNKAGPRGAFLAMCGYS